MSFVAKFIHSFNPSEPGFLFMWVLLVVGVFGIAIMIERFFYLTIKAGRKPDLFIKDILKYVKNDDIASAKKLCMKAGKMALAEVVRSGLESSSMGADQIRNSVEEATLKVIPELEKRINYLATIGNVATLIGLMGTIYGLILSFAAVGKPGIDAAEKSTLLAGGIAAAMNTTLSGLMVAIPAIIVFALFKAKTQKIIDQIDEYSLKLVNVLIEKSYKVRKYHISASQLKEGIGLHVTNGNIKIYTDNKLVKEINI